jgi:RND family efflux transporter MFP subunit
MNELLAQAEFTASDYLRKQGLVARGYETKAALDQVRSARDAAAAAVARAQAQLAFMKLTAPADGLVIKRDGEIGQLIPANQPVFWISCCAPLRISAEIDEEDIGVIRTDQPVLIRADAFPGKIFHGKVRSITPKGDPVTRSYRVRVAFTEETPLQIGMTAETNIVINENKNALLLPNSALSIDNKIWLVKGNRLSPQTVETGAKGAEQTEIRHGLLDEDLVVLNPEAKFKEGQEIRVTLMPPDK